MVKSYPAFWLLGVFFLSGCGGYSLSKPYIDSNYTDGVEIRSHYMAGSSPSQITAMAQSNCRSKGFDSASLKDSSRRGEFQSYLFQCENIVKVGAQPSTQSNQQTTPVVPSTPSTSSKMSISAAKSQCKEIGFTASTEKFADCVMELTK